jgi:hypothetical protein
MHFQVAVDVEVLTAGYLEEAVVADVEALTAAAVEALVAATVEALAAGRRALLERERRK